jgi:hypothetical protein
MSIAGRSPTPRGDFTDIGGEVRDTIVVRKGSSEELAMTNDRIRIEQHSATGLLWFAGWLFSIGFLHLSFWKGALALIVWPYFIGKSVAALVTH